MTDVAFRVDPELLGVDLASPWRRGVALLLDLLIAGIVSSLGGAGVAAFLTAGIAYRVITGRGQRRFAFVRWMGGSFAALLVFSFVYVAIDDDGDDDGPGHSVTVSTAGTSGLLGRSVTASAADDASQTASIAQSAAREEMDAAIQEALMAFGGRDAVGPPDARSEAVATAVSQIATSVADANSDASLTRRLSALKDENDELKAQLASPSVLRTLGGLAEDFGLTFGWVGVYFTLFMAWWNGFTPGKRLMGIRIHRLDGQPFTLWMAFERFAGYAAGLATGLLGFVQIFWDPNRQGIHDKIASTVVVRVVDARRARRRWSERKGASGPSAPSV